MPPQGKRILSLRGTLTLKVVIIWGMTTMQKS